MPEEYRRSIDEDIFTVKSPIDEKLKNLAAEEEKKEWPSLM